MNEYQKLHDQLWKSRRYRFWYRWTSVKITVSEWWLGTVLRRPPTVGEDNE